MKSLATDSPQPLVAICGPTASGKTALGMALSRRFSLEVISADSCQVYRTMDIGTAKPSAEELDQVPHHLIDVVNPDQDFSAADFVRMAHGAVDDIVQRGRRPLLVGGTGLYFRTLLEGLLDAPAADQELRRRFHALENAGGEGTLFRLLQQVDPVLAERIHSRNLIRIVRALEVHALSGRPLSELQREHGFAERPFRVLKFGLTVDREALRLRIDSRVDAMVASGLLAEVEGLLQRGFDPRLKSLQTIGYRECIDHLAGLLSWTETVDLIKRNTRRYAKRQMTWFKKDPGIIWVDSSREFDRICALIDDFYDN